MRALTYLVLVFLLTACGQDEYAGYVESSKPDPETGEWSKTLYSPYLELEHVSDDKYVLARLVVTLGPERVPKGFKHTGPFSDDLKQAYRDGIVDWVSEIYFLNYSSAPVEVKPIKLSINRKTIDFSGVKKIFPREVFITEPFIELHSNYGVETPASFEYEYLGKVYTVEGMAKRLTVDEVKNKYSKK